MSKAHIFQTENARFQVERGSAFYITAAAALADQSQVVGRGIYVDLNRDFEWRHIVRVESEGDQIAFVYLSTHQIPDPANKREGNVTTEITLTTVFERKDVFDAGDQILVCNEAIARPKNRRHGKITTLVNEELAD